MFLDRGVKLMSGFQEAVSSRNSKKGKKKEVVSDGRMSHSWLRKISPRKGYHFYSDYFTIDGGYATILTVFAKQGANRQLPGFWGINLLPLSLGHNNPNVTARLLMMVNSTTDKWFEDHQVKTDRQMSTENADAKKQGTAKQTLNAYKNADIYQVNKDHLSGDKYMWVAFRILIKADTLDNLDIAVKQLDTRYKKNFGGIYADAYQGRQPEDFANIFTKANEQIGKNFMFTSSELAGEYNLVTQGITDKYGEYVGQMYGDVNHSAVIWDMDDFQDHVVIASNDRAVLENGNYQFPKNTRGAAIWAAKIAQNALANNHRVVHLVLNGTDVRNVGQDFPEITTTIGMNSGAINPFEIFGKVKDELTLYPAHIDKLRLMAKQISPSLTDTDLNKNLTDLLQQYYIDQGMWHENAAQYRDKLRVAELPHYQYPKLNRFVAYLETARTGAVKAGDQTKVESIERLQGVYHRMLNDNADLFNQITDDSIDNVNRSRQIVYDFSSLARRGDDIMMAQFVNALGFATNELEAGDVIILQGAGQLTDSVREYTEKVFENLRKHDIRIVYTYDSIDYCLRDAKFNRLGEAEYMCLGMLTPSQVEEFQNVLNVVLPEQLAVSVTQRNPEMWYLRRNADNIIFRADPVMKLTQQAINDLNANRLDTVKGRYTGRIYIDFDGKENTQV